MEAARLRVSRACSFTVGGNYTKSDFRSLVSEKLVITVACFIEHSSTSYKVRPQNRPSLIHPAAPLCFRHAYGLVLNDELYMYRSYYGNEQKLLFLINWGATDSLSDHKAT